LLPKENSLYGYAGRILNADLSRDKIAIQELDRKLAKEYLGGNGFCARFLFDLVGPKVRPLGPSNVLIFAVGPLSGTLWPQTGRYEVAAKSPLTGIYGEANSGGHWGAGLKHSGFDAIVVRGRSKKPVYLMLGDGEAEIRSAKSTWGKSTYETDEELREAHGSDSRVACIGLGGENLVRFASIMTDGYRAAARSGLGAVMGSKRLKAVVVRGGEDVQIADPERFIKLSEAARQKILDHPFARDTTKYGTTLLVEAMNEIGRFPTRNFQRGVFEHANKIGGEETVRTYKVKDRGCFSCPLRCEEYIRAPGRGGVVEGKVEYETLSSFGGRCLNSDMDALLYANHLCNIHGIDTISCGGVIAFAMECYERGILTDSDTGGLDLQWGDSDAIITCVEQIIERKGLGDKLAEGTWRLARSLGKDALQYAMTVKGQDIPAQDSRAQKSMGLAHATANRGADHLTAFEVLSEVGFVEGIEERFGKKVMPEAADRLSPKYKPLMVRDGENFCAVVDSLVVCKFGTVWPPALYFADFAGALTAATGIKYTERKLRTIGERIFTLERAFDIREGITGKDDTLPSRLTQEPAPVGPCKGQVVELDLMLKEYYKLRGWDRKTGLIPRRRLEKLGLGDVARELATMRKLP
jgi:aldehyde:ferredoxin oxidoreductase